MEGNFDQCISFPVEGNNTPLLSQTGNMSRNLWEKSHLHHPLVLFHKPKYHCSTFKNNERTASKTQQVLHNKKNMRTYLYVWYLEDFK